MSQYYLEFRNSNEYIYIHIYIYIYIYISFLLCCPCEALEGPISTRVGIILTTTLIQSRHIIIRIALLYNEINSGQSKLFKYTKKNSMSRICPQEGKGSEVSLRR